MITLILGGARSGKSSFAEKIAQKNGGDDVIYLATAEAKDKEMEKRIKHHQKTRNKEWKTIEEPLYIGEVLSSIPDGKVILIDCITIFVTNHIFSDTNESEEIDYDKKENIIMEKVQKIVEESKNKEIVLVSNEIGMGLVPTTELGREFRDISGRVNQFLAKKADEVYITIVGLPVELKELSNKIKDEYKE